MDIVRNTRIFRIVTWSSLGGVIGALLGVFGRVQGVWGVREIVLFAAIGWSTAFVFPLLLSAASGRAARLLHAPSGRTTPRAAGLSQAESLVARGLYDDAASAFEAAIAADPGDPLPYIRLARMERDRRRDYEAAARWFRRALSESRLSGPGRSHTRRELVEMLVGKAGTPERAAPVLARMAAEDGESDVGRWAAGELARVKALIADAERRR